MMCIAWITANQVNSLVCEDLDVLRIRTPLLNRHYELMVRGIPDNNIRVHQGLDVIMIDASIGNVTDDLNQDQLEKSTHKTLRKANRVRKHYGTHELQNLYNI